MSMLWLCRESKGRLTRKSPRSRAVSISDKVYGAGPPLRSLLLTDRSPSMAGAHEFSTASIREARSTAYNLWSRTGLPAGACLLAFQTISRRFHACPQNFFPPRLRNSRLRSKQCSRDLLHSLFERFRCLANQGQDRLESSAGGTRRLAAVQR